MEIINAKNTSPSKIWERKKETRLVSLTSHSHLQFWSPRKFIVGIQQGGMAPTEKLKYGSSQ